MGDELLRLWRDTGATMLLITHALDEAAMLADRIGVMSARPGRILEIIETGWPRDRDSQIVADPAFGAITARLWRLLREESLTALGGRERPEHAAARAVQLLAVIVIPLAILEILCRYGIIDRLTLPPPSDHRWAIWSAASVGRQSTPRW